MKTVSCIPADQMTSGTSVGLLRLQKFFCSTSHIIHLLYRTIILPIVLYGCETWSLTLREESRLRVFENRVLRRVLGPKRDEVTANGENYIMRSLVICTLYRILCGW